jgi:hypothetical protein
VAIRRAKPTRKAMHDGKTRYRSQEAADAGLAWKLKNGAAEGQLHSYPCDYCPGWHFGHDQQTLWSGGHDATAAERKRRKRHKR